MISTNLRVRDPEDVGLLFHMILRYGEANADRLDTSILSIGYGTLMDHAERAALALCMLHQDTGPGWDGCLWLERLEDTRQGSLAQMLYADEPDVHSIVKGWLAQFN